METNIKGLAGKLAKVMEEVEYIQKKGRNTFHNYNYLTESDVSEETRKAFAKHGLAVFPSFTLKEMKEITTRKGHTEFITICDLDMEIVDSDSGETRVVKAVGMGQDPGDKGIYKAMTGAMKYALTKLLLIPSGDDPEGDSETDRSNNYEPPAKQKSTPPHSQTSTSGDNKATDLQISAIKKAVSVLNGRGKDVSVEDVISKAGLTKGMNALTAQEAVSVLKMCNSLM